MKGLTLNDRRKNGNNKENRNAILIDFEPTSGWNFDKILELETHEKWEILKKVSNLNQGNCLRTLIRYLKYFGFSLSMLIKGRKYGKIVAWQQFYGIIYAFFLRVFKIRKPPNIYIMTFIYKEKHGFVGRVYKKFISYTLKASCIKKIFVFSNSEPEYYSKKLNIDCNQFIVLRLGVEDHYKSLQYEIKNEEKFYLSVGRSNRDYNYLIKHWNDSWGKLKIITDMPVQEEYKSLKIEVIRNCYDQDYYNMLLRCYAVIIPLFDENISSGELVTIQAGMFYKPTIATYNKALQDYIEDGFNGFLCSKQEIGKYINKLENVKCYQKMCINSRKKYENCNSLLSMGKQISDYMD